jgi:hypothetical protein
MQAVSESLSISPSIFGAGLAADDLILTLYFVTIYSLAKNIPPDPEKQQQPSPSDAGSSSGSNGSSSSQTAAAPAGAAGGHGGAGGRTISVSDAVQDVLHDLSPPLRLLLGQVMLRAQIITSICHSELHLVAVFFTKGGAPPTGWPHTTQSSQPDCRGPEAKPHR